MESSATLSRSQASPQIIVPDELLEIATHSLGAFFEPLSKIDRHIIANEFLDYAKSFKRAEILKRYTPLESRKLLEIGSGFGTNLAVWLKYYGVDGWGVEPGGEGFNQGYIASRKLLAANGLDPDRVLNTSGEALPFPDESFDIVYSANVLEHTGRPRQVVAEALRVLRPGGLFHMEMPNHLSYFEGHYMVAMPPLVWKPILPWWIKWVVRRDPFFTHTLRTEINPIWCRRTIRELAKTYPLELISLGEGEFLERLSQPFVFETQMVQGRLQRMLGLMKKLNAGNWLGHLIVGLQGHYPIYMTIRKGPSQSSAR